MLFAHANPSSLPNLLSAIWTRTTLRVATEEKVVTLSDDDLWNVPYLKREAALRMGVNLFAYAVGFGG
jgi:hypothetical protein